MSGQPGTMRIGLVDAILKGAADAVVVFVDSIAASRQAEAKLLKAAAAAIAERLRERAQRAGVQAGELGSP